MVKRISAVAQVTPPHAWLAADGAIAWFSNIFFLLSFNADLGAAAEGRRSALREVETK